MIQPGKTYRVNQHELTEQRRILVSCHNYERRRKSGHSNAGSLSDNIADKIIDQLYVQVVGVSDAWFVRSSAAGQIKRVNGIISFQFFFQFAPFIGGRSSCEVVDQKKRSTVAFCTEKYISGFPVIITADAWFEYVFKYGRSRNHLIDHMHGSHGQKVCGSNYF